MQKDSTRNDSISDASLYSEPPKLYLREKYISGSKGPGSAAVVGPERHLRHSAQCTPAARDGACHARCVRWCIQGRVVQAVYRQGSGTGQYRAGLDLSVTLKQACP